MNKDLTIGNPRRVLWTFCLPLFASVIFQQLYNIADSFVAGKFIGEAALAAVGNSYEITLVFIAFATGCNIGCSVITSRYFGAKDYSGLKTALLTSIITTAIICAILMILGIVFGAPLLKLIKTPSELYADSKLYLDIYIWGIPFVFLYNLATGIFSALGDSRTPFRFLAASSLSNIGMDILFVSCFKMGVAGVAWATFICQGVSCILSLIVVWLRFNKLPRTEDLTIFSVTVLKQFLGIAIPSTIQQTFVSVGNIILQGVINGFGPGVMAGYSAAVKLNNMIVSGFMTLANGISNFTSQNLGAQKHERIILGHRSGLILVWILSIPISLIYVLFPDTLLRLFLDSPSQDALRSGLLFLRIISPFYVLVSIKIVTDGVLRGAGIMKQFMIGTFTDLVLRVVLAIILSRTSLGYIGIWIAWPIGWGISTAMSVVFYRTGSIYRLARNRLLELKTENKGSL